MDVDQIKGGFADDASDEVNPVARFAMNTEMSTIPVVVGTDVPMRNSDAVRKKSMEREGKRSQDFGMEYGAKERNATSNHE